MFMVVIARVGFESGGTTHQYYACILGLVVRGLGGLQECMAAGLQGCAATNTILIVIQTARLRDGRIAYEVLN